jgi:alkylhydroperoxidase/carboxymuconolactone decarboxylase family protein YurZ
LVTDDDNDSAVDDRSRLTAAYEHGRQHLTATLGPEATASFQQRLSALHPDLERYITAFIFGEVRDRPQLDRRTQALCVLAVLVAVGGPAQLAANVRYALAAGATLTEIEEVILLTAPFAGFPAAWNAMAVLRDTVPATERAGLAPEAKHG